MSVGIFDSKLLRNPTKRINKRTHVRETCSFPLWKCSFLWGQSGTYDYKMDMLTNENKT